MVNLDDELSFDRQIRAFGRDGQHKLKQLRVAIVGLGGTGSVVAQQLAHLGVNDFLLIDPDRLERTNLNRVVGATGADIHRPKVDIAKHLINNIRPSALIESAQSDALHNSVAKRLLETDLFFCCTDSHGSRAVLNQLAYQFLLPGFDLGVQIEAKRGRVTHVTGRAQMLAPGLACLVCSNLLDPEAVRRDLLSDAERQTDPYIPGAQEPQPAVISLNSTVASLAINMYLSAVAGIPGRARHQVFRGEVGAVRVIDTAPNPVCIICSESGALGKGDEWPLPGRVS
jgi:molybdopterin/thiamine biosynthesis adenylyltransferase